MSTKIFADSGIQHHSRISLQMRWQLCLILFLMLRPLVGCSRDAAPVVTSSPEKLESQKLPNAYRITPNVISGGLPEGDAAFAELKALGVKTVISVDGKQPDVETAKRHDLRYVHLPHGYGGIPESRGRELAKAVRDLDAPIYIHCHHGKHRSPAAAVVACVSAGLLDFQSAHAVLTTAGTSENYRGLYQSAESARPLNKTLLDQLQVDFRERTDIPPLAEAMVAIEHAHDQLKAIAAADWKTPASHPDLVPAHEALMLREHFAELLRSDAVAKHSVRFRTLVSEGEAASAELETALREWNASDDSHAVPAKIGQALELVSKNCTTCHKEFRDIPLSERQSQ